MNSLYDSNSYILIILFHNTTQFNFPKIHSNHKVTIIKIIISIIINIFLEKMIPNNIKISKSKVIKIIISTKNCIEKPVFEVLDSVLNPASIDLIFSFSFSKINKNCHKIIINTQIKKVNTDIKIKKTNN